MAGATPLSLPAGFEEWSKDEQIEYVGRLWDVIRQSEESVPVYQWQKDAVESAIRNHEADPNGARPWREVHEEMKERVRQRLASRSED